MGLLRSTGQLGKVTHRKLVRAWRKNAPETGHSSCKGSKAGISWKQPEDQLPNPHSCLESKVELPLFFTLREVCLRSQKE